MHLVTKWTFTLFFLTSLPLAHSKVEREVEACVVDALKQAISRIEDLFPYSWDLKDNLEPLDKLSSQETNEDYYFDIADIEGVETFARHTILRESKSLKPTYVGAPAGSVSPRKGSFDYSMPIVHWRDRKKYLATIKRSPRYTPERRAYLLQIAEDGSLPLGVIFFAAKIMRSDVSNPLVSIIRQILSASKTPGIEEEIEKSNLKIIENRWTRHNLDIGEATFVLFSIFSMGEYELLSNRLGAHGEPSLTRVLKSLGFANLEEAVNEYANGIEHFLKELKEKSPKGFSGFGHLFEKLLNIIQEKYAHYLKVKEIAELKQRDLSEKTFEKIHAIFIKESIVRNIADSIEIYGSDDPRIDNLNFFGYDVRANPPKIPTVSEAIKVYYEKAGPNPAFKPARMFILEGKIVPVAWGTAPPPGAKPYHKELPIRSFIDVLNQGYYPLGEPTTSQYFSSTLEHDFIHFRVLTDPEYAQLLRKAVSEIKNSKTTFDQKEKILGYLTEILAMPAVDEKKARDLLQADREINLEDMNDNEFFLYVDSLLRTVNQHTIYYGGFVSDLFLRAARLKITRDNLSVSKSSTLEGPSNLAQIEEDLRSHLLIRRRNDETMQLIKDLKTEFLRLSASSLEEEFERALKRLKN